MLETLSNLDTQLFLFFNRHTSPFWDIIMYYGTLKYTWIPLYLLILFGIGRKYKLQTILIVIFIALLITMTDQLSMFSKELFERWRPCRDPELGPFINLYQGKCGGRFGFFSAHAASSFGLAYFTSKLIKRRWFTISIFTWAAFVAYTRVYLGSHFPGDIIVGAIIGIILGWINIKLLFLFPIKQEKRREHVVYKLNNY